MDLMEDYEGIGKCCEKLGKNEEGIEAFGKIVKAIKETMPEMDFLAKEFQSHIDAMKDAMSKQRGCLSGRGFGASALFTSALQGLRFTS